MMKQTGNIGSEDLSPSASNAIGAADAVIELVHTVMHQFRSLQFQALRDNSLELTHMESKAMGFFARHPGATVSDLVAHSGRDKAQLARLIKGLRERGLLDAETVATDRRSIRLRPSAAGRAMQEAVHAQGQVLTQRAVRGLSEFEQARMAELLGRIKKNLDTSE